MGIVRTAESRRAELEEFHRMLLQTVGLNGRSSGKKVSDDGPLHEVEGGERLVCVTSGVSYLGFAIVNRLLSRGYSVRLALENEDDLEKLREMEMFGERGHHRVSAVMVKLTELESLCEAFDGCRGVFHTSCFADPSGISGYTKWMAEMEHRASQTVIEACARTPSVTKCVFTSSLLACIWRSDPVVDLPPILDESCWSDESFCRQKKLWFALGKTMAEKGAWNVARDRDVQLATICPALITGPEFYERNSTPSIAYLKGAQEMYIRGLLATVDVSSVARAHICVYEETGSGASGRYICFDRVIDRDEEAAELGHQMRMPDLIGGDITADVPVRFELCNRKLSRLVLRRLQCSEDADSGLC
ncbi:cinnamoyl-CoA reductase-like SNL6 [Magnolia sinica]|uniref:cinnamoyl-CoA reductase-like SNL6 n=1 Tax=Magnolia sinica TaxID=86752 RepID=UPI0026598C11|nr:cinnamoyl-CoA reductase-like SNL6 [Magnolia sinica]